MAIRSMSEAIALVWLSAVAIIGALQVPEAAEGETWAGIVPFGAGIGLAIIAAILLVSALAKDDKSESLDSSENKGAYSVCILFLIAVLYQQSFTWFGYLLPTAIAAPVVLYLFNVRSPLGLMLSVVICPLIFHTIFFVLLGVYPPFGEVFDLLSFIQE